MFVKDEKVIYRPRYKLRGLEQEVDLVTFDKLLSCGKARIITRYKKVRAVKVEYLEKVNK